MFDLKEFIVRNLVNGVKNGTFTKEYANITAVNYLVKGVLTEEHVVSVNTQIDAWEAEQNTVVETTEPSEEVTEDTTVTEEEDVDGVTEDVAEESAGELDEENTEEFESDISETESEGTLE